MHSLHVSIQVYLAEQGTLPPDLATVREVNDLNPRDLLDAWKRPILYRHLGDLSYRLISTGPDRREGTEDDIVFEDGYVIQGEPDAAGWLTPDNG